MSVAVITDSACDLPVQIAQSLGVDVVSLTIRFGDEEFVDRVDLTPAQFWAKCKASKALPETAAPSPGAFQAAYQRARDAGHDSAIVLTLSAALSATHQSATLAAFSVPGLTVRVVDTQAVTMAQGIMVMDVAERAAGGASLDDLVGFAEALRDKVGVCAMLGTLDHLVKGGRVGGARALLGQVLSIKPLLELKDGVVAEAGRARTTARALATIVERARAHAPLARLALVHGDSPEVSALATAVAGVATATPLVISDIGPVVGTHAGPGIIGLCWSLP
ncbi:MAG TPA: DegV family protein [Acidimicrobiales bacterium]|nr:DegV family protein [Acidimicrobiales bacterium]